METKPARDPREVELHKQYLDAIRKESIIRESSYLDIELDILGIPVRQFTPYHFILLDFAINPHTQRHRIPNFEDTCEFLWIISPDFKNNNSTEKQKWILTTILQPLIDEATKVSDGNVGFEEVYSNLKELWNLKASEEIFEYLEDAFMDQPEGKKQFLAMPQDKPEVYSWITCLCHTISKAYGWRDNDILHMPYANLFQKLRIITEEEYAKAGEKYIPINKYSGHASNAYFDYINTKNNKSATQVQLTPDLMQTIESA